MANEEHDTHTHTDFFRIRMVKTCKHNNPSRDDSISSHFMQNLEVAWKDAWKWIGVLCTALIHQAFDRSHLQL